MSTRSKVRRGSPATVLRFSPKAPLTDRAFTRLCGANPDLRLERTADGALIVMSPAGTDSGGRGALITIRLGVWSEADGRGKVFDSSTGYTLPNGAIRAPDASWVLRERWAALTPKEKRRFAPICPDFVVELRSPSDRLADVHAKMAEYLEQGARLGWLIDPLRRRVMVYRPDRPVEVLEKPDTLSGGDVLPGFVLDLREILTD